MRLLEQSVILRIIKKCGYSLHVGQSFSLVCILEVFRTHDMSQFCDTGRQQLKKRDVYEVTFSILVELYCIVEMINNCICCQLSYNILLSVGYESIPSLEIHIPFLFQCLNFILAAHLKLNQSCCVATQYLQAYSVPKHGKFWFFF